MNLNHPVRLLMMQSTVSRIDQLRAQNSKEDTIGPYVNLLQLLTLGAAPQHVPADIQDRVTSWLQDLEKLPPSHYMETLQSLERNTQGFISR